MVPVHRDLEGRAFGAGDELGILFGFDLAVGPLQGLRLYGGCRWCDQAGEDDAGDRTPRDELHPPILGKRLPVRIGDRPGPNPRLALGDLLGSLI
ncbi:hypothetical protein GCM10022235_27510 [Kribbella ginsengisoli]|uniref:Uncharacterized protein n=1 Tax=Kribbella ginsengisoli TaxID=363865 RepID=A0ABP6WWM7_9ACTN